jgi:integrase/recombinase XerD
MNKLLDFETYWTNLKKSRTYFNYLKSLSTYLQERNIQFENLTKEQLAEFLSKYKASSANIIINAGRQYALFVGLKNHTFFSMKILKTEKRLATYLTLDEIEQSVRQIATYNSRLNASKMEIILLVMFYLGLRKGEIINLKREAFDLVNSKVKIYAEKTKEEKLLPFPEKLLKKLIAFFNSEEEVTNAFNITEAEINYLFRKVLTKHLGKKISPHQARHGAGRYLLECGIPINVVQKILGHASVTTTMKYADPSQQDIERLYKERIK